MKKHILSGMIVFTIFVSNLEANPKDILSINDANTYELISYPKLNSLEDKIIGLSKVWSEIKYNFVNLDKIDFDIDSLYEATIPKIIATKNDIEYYDEIQRFMACFKDGHTQLLGRTYGWNEYNDYIPIGVIELDKKLYFSSITKGIGIDSTLLGAEIIEVDNMTTAKYVEEYVFPYISSSTDESRWLVSANRIVGGLKGTSLKGKLRKLDGNIVPFSIERNGETNRTPEEESWEPRPVKRSREKVTLEWVDNNIALLNIKSFSPDKIMSDIDSVAKLIHSRAEALIIDLRTNGGGSTGVAHHLQMYITQSDSFLTFGSQSKINDSYGRSQGNYRDEYKDYYLGRAYKTDSADTVYIKESIKPFTCPIVILIGKHTFSAAEDFLVNLYEVPNRPLLIGQSTGGSTGAPLIVSLPHDVSVRICTLRILYPYSGKPFVREGIRPDIVVKQDISDYLESRDVVLEKAIEHLGEKIR